MQPSLQTDRRIQPSSSQSMHHHSTPHYALPPIASPNMQPPVLPPPASLNLNLPVPPPNRRTEHVNGTVESYPSSSSPASPSLYTQHSNHYQSLSHANSRTTYSYSPHLPPAQPPHVQAMYSYHSPHFESSQLPPLHEPSSISRKETDTQPMSSWYETFDDSEKQALKQSEQQDPYYYPSSDGWVYEPSFQTINSALMKKQQEYSNRIQEINHEFLESKEMIYQEKIKQLQDEVLSLQEGREHTMFDECMADLERRRVTMIEDARLMMEYQIAQVDGIYFADSELIEKESQVKTKGEEKKGNRCERLFMPGKERLIGTL
ncbi:uncharacterized protein BYT42DRAFT_576525 [Radiomyces spectabilis]|uniref:uncharacterized protein n=1 Tax=Radiomyces spectabilis TaxID=64574 RepID=UPI00221EE90E|nr:uncharacterized protein BYT42DRAFT_576525 [Radiomyces spectabilis]KAI8374482.1 hypothetical protein BYT42DRAFT_576525 [Radiomyces spectabilis]